ncbi:hypothetical protein QTH97_03835 [Variovorax sp. J22R24]|uniref:hypothetical protein n=1 Tax=Variovorax gracilis TaxID=3053502 RepID=UPI002577C098|nr:hypothetical protein [Variovorax sp. J22R24]MDM0104047.1 hypothetical protein [Variovorax sp. J22R24]
MPVICAVCNTENRDAAMFCHGCARKLPAFAATGPSLLDAMKPMSGVASPFASRATDEPGHVTISAEMRRFWIRIGLLVIAAALGFFGWFAYVTRKIPLRPPETAKVLPAAPAAPSSPPVATVTAAPKSKPPESPRPAEPVPLGNSLGAGEVEVSSGPATAPVQPPVTFAPSPPPERRQPPRAAPPPRAVALDPRSGCETLNFIFAARCEAAHCDKPEYTRHPRCDLVREERRRDEARRNPTLGF